MAVWIQAAASFRWTPETRRASSMVGSPHSGSVGEVTASLKRESATRPARVRVPKSAKNCSTACSGLSSSAEDRNSAYMLLKTGVELSLSFNSMFSSQLFLRTFDPDLKDGTKFPIKVPADDFLPAVVAFKTEAALPNNPNLEGEVFSGTLTFACCLTSEWSFSDTGDGKQSDGDEGTDLRFNDLDLTWWTSFFSASLLVNCFDREELDRLSDDFFFSITTTLEPSSNFPDLFFSFADGRSSFALPLEP
ncbi:hypothetical protein C4D60_Mb09t07320 [Musa balbisiana]|uniref:Uncharacterized protein n=1 Tax=Musa balbisiana TaxID=52838 RepID=A0A4S8IEN6_MUSBA|nr:hypothetical protein C4D60_Mb09t07320 [Musa balbisiana]